MKNRDVTGQGVLCSCPIPIDRQYYH